MEYRPAELATLQHAALIFTNACEGAMSRLPCALPIGAMSLFIYPG